MIGKYGLNERWINIVVGRSFIFGNHGYGFEHAAYLGAHWSAGRVTWPNQWQAPFINEEEEERKKGHTSIDYRRTRPVIVGVIII